jgi:hypothetical protein
MPLQGHWERTQTPLRRTTPRDTRLVAGIAALLVVALAVVVYAAVSEDSAKPGPGCIEVTAAHSTGGATVRACGPTAARWCRTMAARDDPLARAVRARCRSAGLP